MAYKVAIDAGHASNTAGKRTFSFTKTVKMSNGTVIKKGTQYREHYANVMLSDFLAKELKRCGFSIYKTGWNDADASDDPEVSLSTRQKLIKGTPQTKRGIKRAAFAMVNCSAMGVKAAILNEYAFMSNEHEAQDLMASVEYCKECAVEVAKGICEYFGVTYVPEGQEKKEVPKTVAALKKMQKAYNLTQDGEFGTGTMNQLLKHYK